MAPSGLAIIIGAGRTSGAGIARVLADPQRGNLAVALLAKNRDALEGLATDLRASTGGVLQAFATDTDPARLRAAFAAVASHPEFEGLGLALAVWHVKSAARKPILDETPEAWNEAMQAYATGALVFAQESLRLVYAQHGGQTPLDETGGAVKATLVFTGAPAATRAGAGCASYGASRASVRMLAQAVAREHSRYGVHVVHAVASGAMTDDDDDDRARRGATMRGEDVGETYLWLSRQPSSLWTHELDMRPALEQF